MCGIVGFTGNRQAAPILLDGLSKLEYRGYDSAGLAVRDGEALAQVVKAKGRLSNLIEKTDAGNALKGTCGIGHTRWATHGEPSQTNAHPHVSGNCSRSGSGAVESEVVGVHNGIIFSGDRPGKEQRECVYALNDRRVRFAGVSDR